MNNKREPQVLPIDELIKYLEEEKQKGATEVKCNGTLISNFWNSVIMTNEPQM